MKNPVTQESRLQTLLRQNLRMARRCKAGQLSSQLSLPLPGWLAGKRDPGSDGLRSLL